MNAQHTPGPWVVGQYEQTIEFLNIRNHACVYLPDMALIALTGRADDRQAQIDADLIAAAPDLLAALEALVAEQPHTEVGCTCGFCNRTNKARASIAKARGQS